MSQAVDRLEGVRRRAPVMLASALALVAAEARAHPPARVESLRSEREASTMTLAVQQARIAGDVVFEETSKPVSGGSVVLLANGRVVARALTDSEGRFAFRTQATGPFEVRAEIIGRPETTVAVTDSIVRLIVAAKPIDVGAIARGADASRCVAPEADAGVMQLWGEARKALAIEAWVRSEHLFSYEVFQYERELDGEDRIESERGRLLGAVVESPTRSRSPDLILAEGYAESTARGEILYAPDGDVLLSDAFAGAHCFRILTGDKARVGLGFEPLPGRDAVDIEGVMWFDRRTAELRALEYRYTNLGVDGPRAPGGGLEFHALPDGHWTISRWWVRTPMPGADGPRIREEGAEVVGVTHLNGTAVPVVRRAALIGTVTDQPGGDPVSGAAVTLLGTNYEATTNADGRFYIPGLPAGRFRLAASAEPPIEPHNSRDVWLASNQATEITLPLRVPPGRVIVAEEPPRMTTLDSIRTVLAEMGLNTTARLDSLITVGITTGEMGTLVGRVTDFTSGRPIAGVLVRVSNRNLSAITEADGRFAIPELRAGEVVLDAEMLGYAARSDTIQIIPGQIIEATFGMTTRPIALDPISVTVRSRWLDSNGFYERRESGLAGHFFNRADIDRRAPNQFTELLRDLPGVSMVSDEVGKLQVRFRRVTTMTGSFSDLSRGCEPGVYYDGVPMNLGFDRLHEIPLPFIDGVEVYVGAATPIQFKHPCGVILIWTRRPK